jgi:hypothetical protein
VAKIIALLKPFKEQKFPPNSCLISLLSTMSKLFEELILRTLQKHTEERNFLNASWFLPLEQITG